VGNAITGFIYEISDSAAVVITVSLGSTTGSVAYELKKEDKV
jgi:hypothetical protein